MSILLKHGVILDAASLGSNIDLTQLTSSVTQCDVHAITNPDQIIERIRDADVVMTNKVKLNDAIFEKSPSLKLIVVLATGTNNIDLQAAKKRGITVCNITRYGAATVAQHTLMLMLALSTRVLDYVDDVKKGQWEKSPFFCLIHHPIVELAGKTLGIVGYGELGQSVARLAEALGMRVLIAQRIGEKNSSANEARVALDELLPQVDVLSLHCPLTAHTQHLINTQRLSLMKPTAFLINTARGALIDDQALIAALVAGELGGAALDVLDVEPPEATHPLIQAVKKGVPNLIVTPHCAWASREARQRLVEQAAQIVHAFQAGQPINVV
jgi:glycerate dehydrogenase